MSGRGIPFSKINGSGNDFLLIDNRGGLMEGIDRPAFASKVCDRSRSIGADGLILVEPSGSADFRWDFYNADGSRAEMCGNGGRCAARYAFARKIAGKAMAFETLAGTVRASVSGRRVKLQMTRPAGLRLDRTLTLAGKRYTYSFLDTGVPHAVLFVTDLERVDVAGVGRGIRRHKAFAPRGTNVNFVTVRDGVVWARTYERGVEGETLACGTGAVASGILAAIRGLAAPPVAVRTSGGETLTIHFDAGRKDFGEVFLEGDTSWSCDGKIFEEAYRY
ncbi:MAG: diaminopimelate epimerase [Deltaproteobacteria bacterium]|nr:MAG: diaminopimelate epimerase [Deltaproteobacteria bacterium]